MFVEIDDLDTLKSYVREQYPDAINGVPSDVADTGEQYAEFSFSALCRPSENDIAVIKRFVGSAFSRLLLNYLYESRGQIYWRIPIEDDLIDSPQVVRFDPNGPDMDFYTDRPCVLDREWKRYNMYCRVLRSDKPVKAVT